MKRIIHIIRLIGLFSITSCLFVCPSYGQRDSIATSTLAASIKKAQVSGMPEDWRIALQQAQSRNDTAAIGLTYSSYIQSLANISPSSDLEKESKEAFAFLYNTRQYVYYFALYNIFIDWMFANQS